MKILDPGHNYKLKSNKSTKHKVKLKFYKDKNLNNGDGYEGTTNQEVLRALIDRVIFLDNQLPHKNNKKIIKCLRKALILHEQRHLDRLLDKNINVEDLKTFKDSHIVTLEK